MADRIQFRQDTAANWNHVNPVLLKGEIGYIEDSINQFKMGDGIHKFSELPLYGFDGVQITLENLSDQVKEYILANAGGAGSDIVNYPDGEDTAAREVAGVETIGFADREYTATPAYNGMGYVYLRKQISNNDNILVQTMMNKINTIYEIRYVHNLLGRTIIVPTGCVLLFKGGGLVNGTLEGQNTKIVAINDNCIGVTLTGTWSNSQIDSNWIITE